MANGLFVMAKSTKEFLEIFAMGEMMATCQDLSVDCGAIAQFFTAVGHALYTSHFHTECVVKYGHTLGSIEPDRNAKAFNIPKAHSLIKSV